MQEQAALSVIEEKPAVIRETAAPINPAAVLEAISDQGKEAIERVVSRVEKLVARDKQLQLTMSVLLHSKRLYDVARTALSRRMAELDYDPQDGVEALIIKSMISKSMEPFSYEELVPAVEKAIVPFVGFETAAARQREQMALIADGKQAEVSRRASFAELPFALSDMEDGHLLSRGRITLLVGNPLSIKYVMELAAERLAAHHEGLHLSNTLTGDQAGSAKALVTTGRVPRLGVNRWMYEATSATAFAKFLAGWQKLSRQPTLDLLLVDELDQLSRPLFDGYPRHKTAAAAQKVLRKWAAAAGCAVLAGLPWKSIDEIDDSWDGLTDFCDVYVVDALSMNGATLEEQIRPLQAPNGWITIKVREDNQPGEEVANGESEQTESASNETAGPDHRGLDEPTAE